MRSRLLLSLLLAGSLSVFHPGLVNAAEPARPKNDKPAPEKVEVQEKFFWGILANAILTSVFSAFSEWLKNRLTGGPQGASAYTPVTPLPPVGMAPMPAAPLPPMDASFPPPPAPVSAVTELKQQVVSAAVIAATGVLANQLGTLLTNAFLAKDINPKAKPVTPFKVKSGEPNYQAAHIAIMAVDTAGNATGFRPVKAGFRTGERFKVRLISTFDALVAIGNINPSGNQKQIYPPEVGNLVSIKAGVEVTLPLQQDQFFQFAGETGTDHLVVTLIDPRALDGKISRARVYREDVEFGSNFAQEVTPDTYPVISQPIALLHQ